MKDVKIKVMGVALYDGHSVRKQGAVDLKFVMDYSELPNTIKLLQLLNNDIKIQVKMLDKKKPSNLGIWRLDSIHTGSDGVSKVKFNSQEDFVEMNELNEFTKMELFKVKFEADVEIEDTMEVDDDDEEE